MSPYSSFSMTIGDVGRGPAGQGRPGRGDPLHRTLAGRARPERGHQPQGQDDDERRRRPPAPGYHVGPATAEPLATAIIRPSASLTSAPATAVRRPPWTRRPWARARRPSLANGRRKLSLSSTG